MKKSRGFTLAELVIFLVIAAVLAAAALMYYRPTEIQARYQAERLRSDLRHMQMLAVNWNVMLRLVTTGTSYAVHCATSTTAPCPASTATPITDPATAEPFTVALQQGLALTGPDSGGAITLDFDALGRPRRAAGLLTADATLTVTGYTVTVLAITGYMTVTP